MTPAVPTDVAEVRPAARLRGELRLPGDKSVSHRALILAALASGESRITVPATGPTSVRRRRSSRPLGATVERREDDGRTVDYRIASPGAGGLDRAGRAARLRQLRDEPAAAGRDARRPADDGHAGWRCLVATPSGGSYHRTTAAMGAGLQARDDDTLPPLTVSVAARSGRSTTRRRSRARRSSRRSCWPGCGPTGSTTVRESVATRDHTERMLRARGVDVSSGTGPDGGAVVTVRGGMAVQAIDERVPGDVSAAAFWLVAGAIHPDAELTLRDVGVNPTRRAVIDLLRAHGRRPRGTSERPAPDDGDRRTAGRPDRALVDPARRSNCRRRTSRRPSTRSRSCASRPPSPRADDDPRRGRAAPQGVGPDRRGRRPACAPSARGST